MPEFDRGQIVAYLECELSFYDITRCTGRHPSTAMQIWNKWVAEAHTERQQELNVLSLLMSERTDIL